MNTRTNIVLDDELVAQAMARAGVKTKKAAVEAALRAFVRKPDYSGLLALAGTGVIADDYDPKALFTHPRYRHETSEPLAPYQAKKARPAAKRGKPSR
ncbi:MAG: type II toxin-antitoxin system VapB family antitoxin [Ramlibacter sp.]|nr:type II toxin-antitoxin system VapB family antitoxin [Ramlibacter sp.]